MSQLRRLNPAAKNGLKLEEVRKTRKPVRITRFGKPVAEVVPPSTPPHPGKWLGSLKSTGVIRGGERDLEIGKQLTRAAFYDKAVYHFQQAAEKACAIAPQFLSHWFEKTP